MGNPGTGVVLPGARRNWPFERLINNDNIQRVKECLNWRRMTIGFAPKTEISGESSGSGRGPVPAVAGDPETFL